MERPSKERIKEIRFGYGNDYLEQIRQLIQEVDALNQDLSLALSDASIKHKYRADVLERQSDELHKKSLFLLGQLGKATDLMRSASRTTLLKDTALGLQLEETANEIGIALDKYSNEQ